MDRGAWQAMGPGDCKESDMTEATEHRKTEKHLGSLRAKMNFLINEVSGI